MPGEEREELDGTSFRDERASSGEPAPQTGSGRVFEHEGGTIDAADIGRAPVKQRRLPDKLMSDEGARWLLAILLLVLLSGIITAAIWKTENWEQMKGLLDTVLPTVTALLGSAIGFYFGTRSR